LNASIQFSVTTFWESRPLGVSNRPCRPPLRCRGLLHETSLTAQPWCCRRLRDCAWQALCRPHVLLTPAAGAISVTPPPNPLSRRPLRPYAPRPPKRPRRRRPLPACSNRCGRIEERGRGKAFTRWSGGAEERCGNREESDAAQLSQLALSMRRVDRRSCGPTRASPSRGVPHSARGRPTHPKRPTSQEETLEQPAR
jgi:hypothetical protein